MLLACYDGSCLIFPIAVEAVNFINAVNVMDFLHAKFLDRVVAGTRRLLSVSLNAGSLYPFIEYKELLTVVPLVEETITTHGNDTAPCDLATESHHPSIVCCLPSPGVGPETIRRLSRNRSLHDP